MKAVFFIWKFEVNLKEQTSIVISELDIFAIENL